MTFRNLLIFVPDLQEEESASIFPLSSIYITEAVHEVFYISAQ